MHFSSVSPYFKQKLQGLYMNSLQDAKRELAYVEYMYTVHTCMYS